MTSENKSGISFFERYLTLWVTLCIIAGVALGQLLPIIPQTLSKFEYANVSIPVAILIWLMIFPMMLKVDFNSIKHVGKRPKGIMITSVTNWLIKPFTMFGIAYAFFFVVYKNLIPEDLASQYLAGAVLLGAAPCTAMVFVWSYLTKGNAAYTLVQVAINDLIILVAFAPIVAFLLGISGISVPMDTLIISVVLFVLIPLMAGFVTRTRVVKKKGIEYFNEVFVNKFGNLTIVGLLLTLVILFSFQITLKSTFADSICKSVFVFNWSLFLNDLSRQINFSGFSSKIASINPSVISSSKQMANLPSSSK